MENNGTFVRWAGAGWYAPVTDDGAVRWQRVAGRNVSCAAAHRRALAAGAGAPKMLPGRKAAAALGELAQE